MNILNLKLWTTWLLAGLTLAVLLPPETAGATTRTVTSLNDDGGAGTLRLLINASAGGDTINFAVTGTITLIAGELGIARNLTILGPAGGIAVSGNGSSRVFHVVTNISSPSTMVNLSGLTISGGLVSSGDGGGICNDGGILTVNNCAISNNAVQVFTIGVGSGGGICNKGGFLTVNHCTVSGNSCFNGNGGGIHNAGTLTINYCTISGNSTDGGGGGIYNSGFGTHTINNCTLSGNSAAGGGGINNRDLGTLTINNCTLSGNSVINSGGGIGNIGTLTINNCTLSGNNAADFGGGGIANYASLTIRDTIIANNTSLYGPGPDVVGSVSSQGHNFVGMADGSSGWVAGSDLTGTTNAPFEPFLGPLQDNGGPTLTMALLPTSAAIDAGDDAVLDAPLSLTTDQRGVPRKIDSHVDIGAFEYDPPQPGPNYVVTTLDDHNDGTAGGIDCTLREAILAANASANASTITFAPGVTGAIALTHGELLIQKSLAINGPLNASLSLSGNNLSRIFHVTSGTVSLSNLTLRDGFAEGYSFGLFGPGGDGNGGGILNEGTLTLTACTLTSNTAMGGLGGLSTSSGLPAGAGGNGNGGGLFNQGTLHLINCTLSGNSAAGGAGGLVFDLSARGGNGGNGDGGALFNQGTLTVTHCTFSSNSVASGSAGPGNPFGSNGSGNGGGLYQNQGSSTISSSIIAGNSAASAGPEVAGMFTSGSYNLIGQSDGSSGFSNGVNQDQVGSSATPVNPLLGPLADNGGPTPTMALLSGSPAIDQGMSFGLTTDQRGRQRPYDFSSLPNASGGDGSDIGAFELNPGLLTPPLLNIARSANNVVLSWAMSDTGFTLEAKANFNPAIPWTTVPGTPMIVGSQFVVTNGPATGNMFYRLRNP